MITKGLVDTYPTSALKVDVPGLVRKTTKLGEVYFVISDAGMEHFQGDQKEKVAAPKGKKSNGKAPKEAFEEDPAKPAAADEEAPPRFMSGIMKRTYHDKYMKQGGNCGDNVAVKMYEAFMIENEEGDTKLDVNALKAWAQTYDAWRDNYTGLNPGQIRMNVGNRIRAIIKKGETKVMIGKTVLTVAAKG